MQITGCHKIGAFHIQIKKNRVSHIRFVEKRGLIIYLAALEKGAIRHAHHYYAIYRKLPPLPSSPPPHPHPTRLLVSYFRTQLYGTPELIYASSKFIVWCFYFSIWCSLLFMWCRCFFIWWQFITICCEFFIIWCAYVTICCAFFFFFLIFITCAFIIISCQCTFILCRTFSWWCLREWLQTNSNIWETHFYH